jgi:hypothetical protein
MSNKYNKNNVKNIQQIKKQNSFSQLNSITFIPTDEDDDLVCITNDLSGNFMMDACGNIIYDSSGIPMVDVSGNIIDKNKEKITYTKFTYKEVESKINNDYFPQHEYYSSALDILATYLRDRKSVV